MEQEGSVEHDMSHVMQNSCMWTWSEEARDQSDTCQKQKKHLQHGKQKQKSVRRPAVASGFRDGIRIQCRVQPAGTKQRIETKQPYIVQEASNPIEIRQAHFRRETTARWTPPKRGQKGSIRATKLLHCLQEEQQCTGR